MANSKLAESFHAGTLTEGWRWFGAHPTEKRGKAGWGFRVWAPHARSVSVVGDFNGWNEQANRLIRIGEIWEGFIPGLTEYTAYKYAVAGEDGKVRLKADPYGFHTETRPATASKLYDIGGFRWTDGTFRKKLAQHPGAWVRIRQLLCHPDRPGYAEAESGAFGLDHFHASTSLSA